MVSSSHLEEIINEKEGCVNTQVVFVDIEKYSLRRTSTQRETVKRFTEIALGALQNLAQKYISYVQANSINFAGDIIKIPTGDGLAIVFTFEGLYRIHLDFAQLILSGTHEHNCELPCEKFEEACWCNCHPNFRLRVGIADGPSVIFKDVNGNYNVAGNPINTAARLMAYADHGQILMSESAHNNLIQMLPMQEISLEDEFKRFDQIEVKHEVKLPVYQYVDASKEYLNSSDPTKLVLYSRLKQIADLFLPTQMKDMGLEEKSKFMANWMEKLGPFFDPRLPPGLGS